MIDKRDERTVRAFLGEDASDKPIAVLPHRRRAHREHRCSVCGKTGHDQRTCKFREPASAPTARLNTGVEWREPPRPRLGPNPMDADVPKLLRSKPGQWAMIRKLHNVRAARDYAQRCRGRWGRKEFEIVTRDREVYARFRGSE